MRIFLVMAVSALATCVAQGTTLAGTQPVPTIVYGTPTVPYPTTSTDSAAPTVSYTVGDGVPFDEAASLAADWCRDTYGERARLSDKRQISTGDFVTFACVPR